jgi:serine/threonine-protein kinase
MASETQGVGGVPGLHDLVLKPGDVVAGRYVVDEVLGSGGMGVVVRARHRTLGHAVAIKCMRGHLLRQAEAFARFVREARAVAGIQSEHVVRVLDFGVDDAGLPFIVMEYLVGRDLLQELSARGVLPVIEAVDHIVEACAGLAVAHGRGVVHRDIKPANLFLAVQPNLERRVKLLDFGVSKFDDADGEVELTRTTASLGSPSYMSPEQVRDARRVDHRSDLWSLGVVLHRLLTGTNPFQGRGVGAVSAAVVADAPQRLREARPELPEALEAIVLRCLEKSPGDRYPTAASLAMALAPFASERGRLEAARIPTTIAATLVPHPRPQDEPSDVLRRPRHDRHAAHFEGSTGPTPPTELIEGDTRSASVVDAKVPRHRSRGVPHVRRAATLVAAGIAAGGMAMAFVKSQLPSQKGGTAVILPVGEAPSATAAATASAAGGPSASDGVLPPAAVPTGSNASSGTAGSAPSKAKFAAPRPSSPAVHRPPATAPAPTATASHRFGEGVLDG